MARITLSFLALHPFCSFLFLLLVQYVLIESCCQTVKGEVTNQPLLYVFISARNKGHALPYFLSYFDQLTYPRHRTILHVRADHCKDHTIDILEAWLNRTSGEYLDVDTILDRTHRHYEKSSSEYYHEQEDRIVSHMIRLKTEAMFKAREKSSDYILFLDTDAFLTDPDVITKMMKMNLTIVAPMLTSSHDHSNFWGDMTYDFYYESSILYSQIIKYSKKGCFSVPVVHSCVLINLNDPKVDLLTFEPQKVRVPQLPYDDLIAFAMSAKQADISSYICNQEEYGFVEYPRPHEDPFNVSQRLMWDLVIDSFQKLTPLGVSEEFKKYLPPYEPPDTGGLSQIYYLNLDRRPDRREIIEEIFRLAGLEGKRVKAVDGRRLSDKRMEELGVHIVEGYLDPIKKRPMTKGEVGCLLSHHKVWKHVLKNRFSKVMVLEDDAQLLPNFKGNVKKLLAQVASLDWDLIYLGYKFVYSKDHTSEQVDDIPNLYTADYVYWTVGYLLSYSGAKKLVAADPLGNAMPVDEFLPLMFDRTDQAQWKHLFPERNVRAFVHVPKLLEQRFYVGDSGYVSDTENIDSLKESKLKRKNQKKTPPPSVAAESQREERATGDDAFIEELGKLSRRGQKYRINFDVTGVS